MRSVHGKVFRHVYIVESRSFWEGCCKGFDASLDLVLTYDFGLKKDIECQGGISLFLDHLIEPEVMQKNNFLSHDFFNEWHLDCNGKDLFVYRGVPFGFSFRIDIWNDFIFYIRTRLCLEEGLKEFRFEKLYAGTKVGVVESVLNELSVPFVAVVAGDEDVEAYYFPIFRYMHENTRSFHWKSKLKDAFMLVQGSVMPWWDKLTGSDKKKPLIFIHEYHPTRKILVNLRNSRKVRVLVERISVTSGWSRYFTERPIPLWGNTKKFNAVANEMLGFFKNARHASLRLSNGSDVSLSVYQLIEDKLRVELANQLRILNAIIDYVDVNPVSMEVLIGNIGRFPTLLDCVLKQRSVPSYLIINGLLGSEYSDESKYAAVINGYSESIKQNYFKRMNNIVCNGDPRMDAYAPVKSKKEFPHDGDVRITIGASGFNSCDLNSYVAVEFDFLYDVLTALKSVKNNGKKMTVTVKVRPNGYREQYEAFVAEYFPDLVGDIIDAKPMNDVLEKADFYISIYSQTLFEASCMGIPVVYYKKDNEMMDAPFDEKSELVTVSQVDNLVGVIMDFYSGSERFDAFLNQPVMERYIGFLDGKNYDRNVNVILKELGVIEK